MPQVSYRANLSAAIFPFAVPMAGRTVIVPGQDNNYDKRVDPSETAQRDAGIPQALYLENVMPTAAGYQSVGWKTTIGLPGAANGNIFHAAAYRAGLASGVNNPLTAFRLYYSGGTDVYSSYVDESTSWQPVIYFGNKVLPTTYFSAASVRGESFVHISGTSAGATYGFYKAYHTGTTLQLENDTVNFIGLGASVRAISSNFNYLVALTQDGKFKWSSTTNPRDFTPSLVTGAGETAISHTNNTTALIPCPTGFYIFADEGITYVEYTGNARYPWRFLLVEDTTQVLSYTFGDVNSSSLLVIDSVGTIRRVSKTESAPLAPELTLYLRQQLPYYQYNYATDVLTEVVGSPEIAPKIYFFYDRYICVSVEPIAGVYGAVIVYDVALKRYGRLRRPHTHLSICDTSYDGANVLGSNTLIATNTATLNQATLDMDAKTAAPFHESVLILGRFKYVRSRRLCIHETVVEGVLTNLDVRMLPSAPGQLFAPAVIPYEVAKNSYAATYNSRAEGYDVSLAIKGQFSINHVDFTFEVGGGR